MIIGLMGFARVGKDFCANVLKQYGFEQRAFAEGVRKTAVELNPYIEADGVLRRYNDLIAEFGYEVAKVRFPAFRAELITIGHGLRKVLGDDVWIRAALHDRGIFTDEKIVVSDVRYPNEVKAINDRGGIIVRITREGIGPVSEIEEQSLALCEEDFLFRNDGRLEDLPRDFIEFLKFSLDYPPELT